MVIGGIAVRWWGVPRPTYDADFAVAVDESDLARLLTALSDAGFAVPIEHTSGFRDVVAGMEKVKVTRFEHGTVWDIDIFLVRTPHLESALRRRRPARIDGRVVQVMAVEDLIVLRLMANRFKDLADIQEMLRIVKDLDVRYLRRWAARMKLTERLNPFLKES